MTAGVISHPAQAGCSDICRLTSDFRTAIIWLKPNYRLLCVFVRIAVRVDLVAVAEQVEVFAFIASVEVQARKAAWVLCGVAARPETRRPAGFIRAPFRASVFVLARLQSQVVGPIGRTNAAATFGGLQ